MKQGDERRFLIPLAFEGAWVLATRVQPNHIVHLSSGASLSYCRRATSSVLGRVHIFRVRSMGLFIQRRGEYRLVFLIVNIGQIPPRKADKIL